MSSLQLNQNSIINSNPVGSFTIANQAVSGNAFQYQQSYERFADQFQNKTTEPQFGALPKSLGTKNAENRRLLKGWALRYGSPLVAIAVGFISGPCACCVIPLSLIGLFFAERKGNQIIKNVKKQRLEGLPKHVEGMRHIWEETDVKKIRQEGNKPYRDLRNNYNDAVKILFTKKNGMQRRLLLRKNNRLNKLLEKMFYVQVLYRNRVAGKFIRWIRKTSEWPILRFPIFRYPILAFSWSLQLVLTLFSSGKANRLIKQASRHL